MTRFRAAFAGLIVLLVTVLWTAPSSLFATLSPDQVPAGASGVGPDEAHARLLAVRERLARREAFQLSLDRQIAELRGRSERLQQERETGGAELVQAREEARQLERRLDYLVPRLLARQAGAEQRRAHAAHVLADLAGLSRQVGLDPRIRSRLLAVSPVMLARLRNHSPSVAALEGMRDGMLARQGELATRQPHLLAEHERLERARREARTLAESLMRRRAPLLAEIAALRDEQVRLARELIAAEAARLARAERQPHQPALASAASVGPGGRPGGAVVKGIVGDRPRPLEQVGRAEILAIALPEPALVELRTMPHVEPDFVPPPPAKPLAVVDKGLAPGAGPAGERASLGQSATVDVALADLAAVVAPPGRSPLASLPEPPIMPGPGQVMDRSESDGGPGITIAASPGQAVAAPGEGRVVFAGPFRSYGLLLIIEHDREYHTLLWGFSQIDVAAGDHVRTGQVVGVMDAGGRQSPELHVELRRNGRPVNSVPWLAASNSRIRG